jgi:phosphohistidine phosphatase
MTRLYILRHAKAATAIPGMRDFDRPLEAAGRIAAGALGRKLALSDVVINAVICSPSLRTRQTLEDVTQHLPEVPAPSFVQEVYTGEWNTYLDLIRGAPTEGSLMIVGHNPSCEDIVHQLVGSGEKQALRKLLDGFAPGTLAAVDFAVPFAQLGPRMGYLESLLLDGCTKR